MSHRHAEASEVGIRLDVDAERVWLEIKDNGKGILEERLRAVDSGSGNGIGLAGIRERVRELGGHLTIESSRSGTLLRISVPITATAAIPSRAALHLTIPAPAPCCWATATRTPGIAMCLTTAAARRI